MFEAGDKWKGNKDGRPKGAVSSITQAVRDKLREKAKGSKLTNAEKVVESIIQKANEGDKEMLKLVWNYIDGLPKATLEVEIPDTLIGLIKQANEDITKEQGDSSVPEEG